MRALIGLDDDLASVSAPIRVALCAAPPAPCGDPRFDAALAAIVDYQLSKGRLPMPDWVREPSRVLKEDWVVTSNTDVAEVPAAFRRHGVILTQSELASVCRLHSQDIDEVLLALVQVDRPGFPGVRGEKWSISITKWCDTRR